MSASLRKSAAVAQRTYKERSQPSSRRAKFGLLEKHRDYVERARDFHRKADRLRALKEKARGRNEDEFYHGMIKAKVQNGVHLSTERNTRFSGDMLQVLKSQDLAYVKTQRQVASKKVDRLRAELAFVGTAGVADVDEDEDMEDIPTSGHTVFVDSPVQVDKFSAARHFQTLPSLVKRVHNRPRIAQLLRPIAEVPRSTVKAVAPTATAASSSTKSATLKKYRELEARVVRAKALSKAERELEVQKMLGTQKGRRRKVATDADGNAVYKWRAERKK